MWWGRAGAGIGGEPQILSREGTQVASTFHDIMRRKKREREVQLFGSCNADCRLTEKDCCFIGVLRNLV